MTGSTWQDFTIKGTDTVYTHFHSDGSGNDWGYKVTITGLPHGDAAATGPSGDDDAVAIDPSPVASCWMLSALLDAPPASLAAGGGSMPPQLLPPMLAQQRILDALVNFLLNPTSPSRHRTRVMVVLQALLERISSGVHALAGLPQEAVASALEALPSLGALKALRKQVEARLSGRHGANDVWQRPDLQAAVEVVAAGIAAGGAIARASASAGGGASTGSAVDKDSAKLKQAPSAAKATRMKWTSSPVGPDVVVSDMDTTVTRTDSSGWGAVIGTEWLEDGAHEVQFRGCFPLLHCSPAGWWFPDHV